MKKKKVIMFMLVACFVLIIAFESKIVKNREKNKEDHDFIKAVDACDFIKKDKDTGQYVIIKEKITFDSLSFDKKDEVSVPRSSKIRDSIVKNPNSYFKNLDLLGQYNVDEQVYLVGLYYLYFNDKSEALDYINILERNINYNIEGRVLTNNKAYVEEKNRTNQVHFWALTYAVIGLCVFILAIITSRLKQ